MDVLITLAIVAAFASWFYGRGKAEGSRKGFGVGRYGRRR